VRRRIGYLHVPKAAGSSGTDALVHAALASASDDQPVTVCPAVFDRTLYGTFDDFESFAPVQRSMVFTGPTDTLAQFDVVVGHYCAPSLRHGRADGDLVMLLREPRARLLSLYTYWRSWTEAEHASWGRYDASRHAVRLDWPEFLDDASIAPQIDNVATRLLLGPHPLIPGDSFILDAHVGTVTADALAVLGRLGHTDVIENGPACWDRLGQWADLVLDIAHHNETPLHSGPPASWAAARDETTSASLHRRTVIDRELWLAAAARQEVAGTTVDHENRADAIFERKLAAVTGRTSAGGVVPGAVVAPVTPATEDRGIGSAWRRWRRRFRGS
jgi:hypothetical protein